MKYQVITVTESTGKDFQFVCPVLDETKTISSIKISEPVEEAPPAMALSRTVLKNLSYMLSMLALHLNLSYRTK